MQALSLEAVLKSTLIETISNFNVTAESLSISTGIDCARLASLLSADTAELPTLVEYKKIMAFLPVSLAKELHALKPQSATSSDRCSEIVEELEFVDAVVGLMAESASERQFPMIAGLQRQLRRIRNMF